MSNNPNISFDEALVLAIDWLFSNAEQARIQSESSMASYNEAESHAGIPNKECCSHRLYVASAVSTPTNIGYPSSPTGPLCVSNRHSSYDLSCPVCFEVCMRLLLSYLFTFLYSLFSVVKYYRDRVATPCMHFFCRPCILDYMSHTGDASTCLCPMCRQTVVCKFIIWNGRMHIKCFILQKIDDLVSVPYMTTLSEALRLK